MRLLFVTPYWLPASHGGIESQVETFSRSLAASGHPCAVLGPAPEDGGEPERGVRDDGVPLYRSRWLDPAQAAAHDPTVGEEACRQLFGRIFESEGIESVLAHNLHVWVPSFVPAALHQAAARRGIPVSVRIHNFCDRLEAASLRSFPWHRRICVSRALARNVAAQGLAEAELDIVYPPIDTELFRARPSRRLRERLGLADTAVILLQASRLAGGPVVFQQKGVPRLLELFASLAREPESANTHLVFSAARPEAAWKIEFEDGIRQIREQARALGLEDRVHVLHAARGEMPELYSDAQIFVLLSRLETFGQVYAEASACALPVVGAPQGGVPEVIADGETGFLVSDDAAARDRLRRLVGDRGLRQRMGRAGREHVVRRFGVEVARRRLLGLVDKETA